MLFWCVAYFWMPATAAAQYEWSAKIIASPPAITSNDFELTAPQFKVSVTNTGTRSWEGDKNKPLLSYHIFDERDNELRWDNERFELPNLKPQQTVALHVAAPKHVPTHSGKLILTFDIVREGVNWFSHANATNRFPSVTLQHRAVSIAELRNQPALASAKALSTGVRDIDLATSLAFYTLKKAQSKIATLAGPLTVLNAGGAYPQAWIRDCATATDAAYLALGDAAAKGCILLHLHRQHDDGYVNDWVDAKGAVDKNTVESDQESSLVIATAEYIDRSHDLALLNVTINGVPVMEHLRRALDFVWTQRRDPQTGLVISGHTIDWGDVSIEEADQQAVYLSARSHLVAGIYSNAMYVLAIGKYLDLLDFAQETHKKELALWEERTMILKRTINARLWDAGKGWYVMHRHVTPFSLSVDEDAMFAMGGNAIAIDAGIADETQAKSIFDNALRMQKRFGAVTISGVLYPPYPDGVYRHPLVARPYQYQNGGLWDWFGLRLVRTMFVYGRAAQGRKALEEIAAKVVRNRTFSEWDDLAGKASGSRDYVGAAGEYICAVLAMRASAPRVRRNAKKIATCGNEFASPLRDQFDPVPGAISGWILNRALMSPSRGALSSR